MAKNNTWLFIALAAVVVILFANGTIQSWFGGEGTIPPAPGENLPEVGCNIAPSVSYSLTDKLNAGTAITQGVSFYKLNGVYVGTTSPTTLGTMDVILNASGYIADIVTGFATQCGPKQLTSQLYAQTNASLTYYDDSGVGLLGTTVASGNETLKAAGASYNWRFHLQGVDKKSTGQQVLIVELSVPANVSSLTLNAPEVPVPNGYTRQLTNGYAKAWLLPAIVGNNFADYNLAAVSATDKIIYGNVFTTIYNVMPFVETDGTFSNSGLAFDSLNTGRYFTTQTKNFDIV